MRTEMKMGQQRQLHGTKTPQPLAVLLCPCIGMFGAVVLYVVVVRRHRQARNVRRGSEAHKVQNKPPSHRPETSAPEALLS